MELTVNRSIDNETPMRLQDLPHGIYTCNIGNVPYKTLVIKGYSGHGAVGLDGPGGIEHIPRSWVNGSDDWNQTELRNVKRVTVDAVTVTETGD